MNIWRKPPVNEYFPLGQHNYLILVASEGMQGEWFYIIECFSVYDYDIRECQIPKDNAS